MMTPIDNRRESLPEKRDWKGLAAIITALLAVLGFAWNKVEGCAEQVRSNKVQAESYNELATKVAVLSAQLDSLNDWVKMMFPAVAGRYPAPAGPSGVSLKHPEQLMQKAGLPTFDALKERAQAK